MHIFNLHGRWWLSQMLENCSLILVNDLVKPFKHLQTTILVYISQIMAFDIGIAKNLNGNS